MIKLKNPEEVEILREGGKRLAEILSALVSKVAPGVSALELEEEARRLIKEGGDKPAFLGYRPQGAKRPFPAALCVSINDEIVHGIPNETEKIIKEGDIVSLDFGILHRGLVTDAAITVPAGSIDEESRKLIETTRTALERGIEAALPGRTIGDIGAAISKVVRPSGFVLADDLVGHGVGYRVHEDPLVPNFGIEGKGEKLVPGLVIALEPMVNVGQSDIRVSSDGYTVRTRDGSRSAHFEHSIAITEKGNIILTL
ncbi:MAG: Methionine aminopeptidase [Parcubacteria group bacterium GW2011_GWA2_45_15]|nr:MAG: Methionine aminopeptidase [Parcubacteria group bacterium GW2011_GWA2_45_15]